MKSEAVITGNSEKLIFMKKKLKIKLKKNKRKRNRLQKEKPYPAEVPTQTFSSRRGRFTIVSTKQKKVTVATFDSEIRISDFAIEREIR